MRFGQGWIDPDSRTTEQRELHEAFESELLPFGDLVEPIGELPKKAMGHELQKKATGKLNLRVWQQTGSCVGAAGAQAYASSMAGDVAIRGDQEQVILPFPYATYGVGRERAGFRSKGSGSFGGAQAWAIRNFGMIESTDKRFPEPKVRAGGWAVWSSRIELAYSHPRFWPVPFNELKPDANDHVIESIVKITSFEQTIELLAQGYGITFASMFAARPRVRNGLLVGPRQGSWAHQMSTDSYWLADDPDRPDRGENGDLILCHNQWGPSAHGDCPYLSAQGIRGSFWIPKDDWNWILRNGEVYGHSNTQGFPIRRFEWGEWAIQKNRPSRRNGVCLDESSNDGEPVLLRR